MALAEVITIRRNTPPSQLLVAMLNVADELDEVTDDIADPTELGLLTQSIAEVRRVLAFTESILTKRMANNMVEKRLETTFGTFERNRDIKRTQWDGELKERAIADVLLNEGLVDTDSMRPAAKSFLEALPFGLTPKVTGLRKMGYDPADWCSEEDNGYTIKATTDREKIRKALA